MTSADEVKAAILKRLLAIHADLLAAGLSGPVQELVELAFDGLDRLAGPVLPTDELRQRQIAASEQWASVRHHLAGLPDDDRAEVEEAADELERVTHAAQRAACLNHLIFSVRCDQLEAHLRDLTGADDGSP
jgi:hypothetical protein